MLNRTEGRPKARQRLGAAPLEELFDLVRGPAATIAAQVRWRGLLVVAVDGTLLPVPDTPANLTVFAKQRCNHGSGGYPQVRLAALVAWETRAVIGAVFPSAATAELEYAGRLAGDLRAGMLLLGDRNFAAVDLAGADKSSTQVGRLITDLWFSSTFTPRVFTCAGPRRHHDLSCCCVWPTSPRPKPWRSYVSRR
ncbi:hypothetical protein [Streptomyces sp. NPDC094472]|uniref:hypothetical protein n=1 Tax=Streptomyces sp. NPDC094472 TaxID=3155080 RepID=UPI00332D0200